jgi:hypothetical protein
MWVELYESGVFNGVEGVRKAFTRACYPKGRTSDFRILGSSEFVKNVISEAEQNMSLYLFNKK